MSSFGRNDLKEKVWIDLSRFESEVYVVLFKEFRGNNGVDLKVNFVKNLIDATDKKNLINKN